MHPARPLFKTLSKSTGHGWKFSPAIVYTYAIYLCINAAGAGAARCRGHATRAAAAPSVGIELINYADLAHPDAARGLLDAALLNAFGRDGLGVVGIRGVPDFPAAR